MIEVTYLGHSGFLVELETAYLLFDYYKGILPVLEDEKHLYVFASHAHFDHYKKKIFGIRQDADKITFILSNDIQGDLVTGKENLVYMGPNEDITVGPCDIKTLRSTDEGVAFLVSCNEILIYHAGDLNWWHWEEENDVFNTMMKRNYQHEVNKLKDGSINVAFVPVDPRLSKQYYWGLDYFMNQTDTQAVFPMHFWDDYSIFDRLETEKETVSYRDKIHRIEKEGQTFLIEQK